ncbi:NAD-binding protein [Athelia psychrophila]|uniref:NAD-binding protein n=1 Tax=Athelia psychrophila TaxID=1759441 RepID=A0A166MHV0_9AGAM|nr:NAD-binding protein [Fibularhizoctonia sp. CBS 109695]KZP24022.1 NAD-binding protein [Fibularhizoctonia sp. CBS 109695]
MSIGIALVTGSAQGIGRAISLRLADDGFDVAVNDIPSNQPALDSLVDEIRAKGRQAVAVPADVTQEEQVKEMVAKAVKDLGGLDVMVANAGICHSTGSVVETTVENWDRHFDVNVKGVFFCYKHAGVQMVAQGRGGRIIGAASVSGKRGNSGFAPYSASKFAVRGLTQSLAQELGPHRITVNTYAPGIIDTPLMHNVEAAIAQKSGQELGALAAGINAQTALGYIGKPEDIASLVSYIASKEAHFITGQSVSANGGSHFD